MLVGWVRERDSKKTEKGEKEKEGGDGENRTKGRRRVVEKEKKEGG
jgi:hypothetical protein